MFDSDGDANATFYSAASSAYHNRRITCVLHSPTDTPANTNQQRIRRRWKTLPSSGFARCSIRLHTNHWLDRNPQISLDVRVLRQRVEIPDFIPITFCLPHVLRMTEVVGYTCCGNAWIRVLCSSEELCTNAEIMLNALNVS